MELLKFVHNILQQVLPRITGRPDGSVVFDTAAYFQYMIIYREFVSQIKFMSEAILLSSRYYLIILDKTAPSFMFSLSDSSY